MIAKGAVEDLSPEARLKASEEELQKLRAEVEKLRARQGPDLAQLTKDIRKRWFRFITDKVNPGHQERHHSDLSSWTPELFKEAGDLGLFAAGVPQELGGDGLDTLSVGIILEELAKVSEDPGFLVMMVLNKHVIKLLAATGREDLVAEFAVPMLKGELVAGLAVAEPGESQAIKSSAKKTPAGWELNGAKPFVTAGCYAGAFIVSARDVETGENMLFIVRREDPGVTVSQVETVGGRHVGYAAFTMKDVKLPAERLVVDVEADVAIMALLNEELVDSCAIHIGWLQRIFNLGIEALRPRVRAGMALLSIPHVQGKVGRLHIGIELVRAMFLHVLNHYRLGKNDPLVEPLAVMLKYELVERVMETAHAMIQLNGVQSHIQENPWGRYLTHVIALLHAGPVQDLVPQQLGERFLAEYELRKLRKFTM